MIINIDHDNDNHNDATITMSTFAQTKTTRKKNNTLKTPTRKTIQQQARTHSHRNKTRQLPPATEEVRILVQATGSTILKVVSCIRNIPRNSCFILRTADNNSVMSHMFKRDYRIDHTQSRIQYLVHIK